MPRGNKAVPVAATSVPEEVLVSQPSHTDPQAPFVDETPYQRFLRRHPHLVAVPGSTPTIFPETLQASSAAIPTSYFARRATRAGSFGGRPAYRTPYRRAYTRSYSRPTYRRSYARRY